MRNRLYVCLWFDPWREGRDQGGEENARLLAFPPARLVRAGTPTVGEVGEIRSTDFSGDGDGT